MKENKRIQWLRLLFLFLILAYVTYESSMHQVLGGGKAPSAHALCPYGGLESLYQLFATGSFISKIFAGTMILFGITVVLALVFRRSFCGLICPFGAIQEYSGKLGKKLFRKKYILPVKLDQPLRYLKYLVLILTVTYAWKNAGLWMSPYDPWAAYSHLSAGLGSVWSEYAVGLILLIITILGSLLYDRFFCKYLCPMGALYGIIGKVSPFRVVRNQTLCIECGKCNRVCPVNIDVQHCSNVTTAECINCQTCVLSCPASGALESNEGKKSIKPLYVIILVMALFFGSILMFQVAGIYQVTSEPLKTGEVIGFDEIKGYMTIKEAAEGTNIGIKEFYREFKIPEEVSSETKMKDISKVAPDYDFDKIKESLNEESK